MIISQICMTPKEVYENIFKAAKENALKKGLTEDKANRRANIIAIKNTWTTFNDILRHNNS